MSEWFKRLWQLAQKNRFLRFCITGGLNTAIDYLVYTLLTLKFGMGLYIAQVISYSAGMLNSYCVNRKWTFDTNNRFFGREMGRFIAVNLMILGISIAVMYGLNTALGWHYLIIKAMTVVITMVLGFAANRLLVFRGGRGE